VFITGQHLKKHKTQAQNWVLQCTHCDSVNWSSKVRKQRTAGVKSIALKNKKFMLQKKIVTWSHSQMSLTW